MGSSEQTPLGWQWVVGQFVLFLGILAVPGGDPQIPLVILGLILGGIGAVILLLGLTTLGRSLSAFPRPKADGELVQSGIYALVRHPIYFGILSGALGVSLLRASLGGVALTVVLFVWFDRKAALEERWLTQKHPAYAQYKTRVSKLIPWVY